MDTLEDLSRTGISQDYFGEWVGIRLAFPNLSDSELAQRLSTSRLRKYTDRISPQRYKDVITPENQATIRRLDRLVDETKAFASPENFSREKSSQKFSISSS